MSFVFFVMAVNRIARAGSSSKTVEAPVVLVFASINLVFDIISTVMFVIDRKDLVDKKDNMNVNYFSAFLHIMADFMRTLSELGASLYLPSVREPPQQMHNLLPIVRAATGSNPTPARSQWARSLAVPVRRASRTRRLPHTEA